MSTSPPLIVADRYRLVAPLGQGGMGRVWRATDVVLHREVAIKELVPPPGLTPEERQEMRERSLREARAIARLNNINVVRVFDVLRTDADPWIVMEYVPSRSLQDVLAQDGPFAPVRAAEIGLGVLNALRAAHRAGVVHRDVKPGNVLISEDGRVVLTDFGLATVPGDPNVTRTGLVLGSPAYIAPERARDGTAGPAADLWSLGATLYAAVEGASPFARPSAIATLAALATENPPPARNAGPLKPVLNGLLRKDPAHRINADEAERLLLRATGRRSKLSFPMSPTMRRPGIGRERPSATVLPPVVPGVSASAPVVPGPRPPVTQGPQQSPPAAPGRPQGPPVTPGRQQGPPVTPGHAQSPAASGRSPGSPTVSGRSQSPSAAPNHQQGPAGAPGRSPIVPARAQGQAGQPPAAGGRAPVFLPGKASVGRPPAETPTRVDGAKPPELDATKIDNPNRSGTGSAAQPPAGNAQASRRPALDATMRGSGSAFGSITADEVAAHRKRPPAPTPPAAAPEPRQQPKSPPAVPRASAAASTVSEPVGRVTPTGRVIGKAATKPAAPSHPETAAAATAITASAAAPARERTDRDSTPGPGTQPEQPAAGATTANRVPGTRLPFGPRPSSAAPPTEVMTKPSRAGQPPTDATPPEAAAEASEDQRSIADEGDTQPAEQQAAAVEVAREPAAETASATASDAPDREVAAPEADTPWGGTDAPAGELSKTMGGATEGDALQAATGTSAGGHALEAASGTSAGVLPEAGSGASEGDALEARTGSPLGELSQARGGAVDVDGPRAGTDSPVSELSKTGRASGEGDTPGTGSAAGEDGTPGSTGAADERDISGSAGVAGEGGTTGSTDTAREGDTSATRSAAGESEEPGTEIDTPGSEVSKARSGARDGDTSGAGTDAPAGEVSEAGGTESGGDATGTPVGGTPTVESSKVQGTTAVGDDSAAGPLTAGKSAAEAAESGTRTDDTPETGSSAPSDDMLKNASSAPSDDTAAGESGTAQAAENPPTASDAQPNSQESPTQAAAGRTTKASRKKGRNRTAAAAVAGAATAAGVTAAAAKAASKASTSASEPEIDGADAAKTSVGAGPTPKAEVTPVGTASVTDSTPASEGTDPVTDGSPESGGTSSGTPAVTIENAVADKVSAEKAATEKADAEKSTAKAAAVPAATTEPTRITRPAQGTKPAQDTKSTQGTKPTQDTKLTTGTKPTQVIKPLQSTKATQATKASAAKPAAETGAEARTAIFDAPARTSDAGRTRIIKPTGGKTPASKADDTKVAAVAPVPAFGPPARPAWQPMTVREPSGGAKGITIFGTTLTRRQTAIGIGVLVAVLLTLVFLVPMAFADDREQAQDNGRKAGVAPVASATTKPAPTKASASPAPSAVPSKPAAAAPVRVPKGWYLYKGDGYSVPVPNGSSVRTEGSEVYISKNNRLLIIDHSENPKPDPVADWQAQEDERRGSKYRNYDRVSLKGLNYHGKAADWEFTYTTDSGNPQHAVKRGFVTTPGKQAYSISWYVSPEDWAASQKDLKVIYQGFEPTR